MNQEQVFNEIINKRRSVRAFQEKSVKQEKLTEIFELAQRSPSNCNTQPWISHVVSGSKIEALRTLLTSNMAHGKMSFDFPYNGVYQGDYKSRQHDAALTLYNAVGIAREEKSKRQEVFMKNYEFFGAPHVVFIFLPEEFGLREAADIGMYAQTLMLTLTAYGLASCPQTALGFHADAIKDSLGIDSKFKLLFGISFGYEDISADINKAKVGRAPLDETTYFHQ